MTSDLTEIIEELRSDEGIYVCEMITARAVVERHPARVPAKSV
ncbi:hypothetical protein [Amycolatopsis panacis]|nr:hypothetical protein [Amycolatopsis panacis]